MSFPKAILSAVVCLLSAAPALVAQNQYIVFYPGSSSSSTDLYVYQAGTLLPQQQRRDVGAGTFLVLPVPDGSKNYLIANGGGIGLTAVDGSFNNPRAISGTITAAPQTAAISPDGRRLVYAANRLYFVETASDAIMNPAGLEITGTPVDIAFSYDSSKAFVLSRGTPGASGTVISVVDLTTMTVTQTAGFRGENTSPATGIVMAPTGYLYVSNNNTIWEIDPRTLQLSLVNNVPGEFIVTGYPDKGYLTGDGKYLVFANKRPVQGNTSLIQLDLTTKTVATFPNFNAEILTSFFNAGVNGAGSTSLYAVSESGRLYDVNLGNSVVINPAQLNQDFQTGIGAPVFNNVAFSTENPARYGFVTSVNNGTLILFQSELRERRVQQTTVPVSNFRMQFVTSAALIGGTQMLGFNGNQTIASGTQSALPLVVRLVDAQGRGVSGARVSFFSSTPGVAFSNPQFITGSEGYAQTYVTAPTSSGQFQVIANGGSSVPDQTFTFSVPGSGGGPGSGPSAGGIFVISGNGQLVREQFQSAPFIVQVRDNDGKPIPNVPVSFTITQGQGTLSGSNAITLTTDANGKAETIFLATTINAGFSFQQATVEAASTVGRVSFFITTVVSSGLQPALPTVYLEKPTLEDGRVIRGRAGETVTEAIRAVIVAGSGPDLGRGIPNIGIRLEMEDPDGPTATCDPDALSTADGRAICNIKFGPKVGTNFMTVVIGEFIRQPPLRIDVAVGSPSKITALNAPGTLNGKAGEVRNLRVRVADAGGNLLTGVPIRWTVVRGTGTLSAAQTTSDSSGGSQTNVTLGGVPGPLQVRAAVSDSVFVNFDLSIDVTVGRVTAVSGGDQSIFVGRPFPLPLVVSVTDQAGAPLTGISVGYTLTGPASLSSATSTTDSTGRAVVNVTAGSNPGPVRVTAQAAGLTATFDLTVQPPAPVINAAGFANGASFEAGLVPCGLAVISGANLVPGITGTVNAPQIGSLPFSLGPVESVMIGGLAAPIQYVSNAENREQIGIQVPCEVGAGSARADLRITGLTATSVDGVQVLAAQPGIYEYTASNGQKYALAYRPDGSLVGPNNPAVRGETVSVVVTGLGQTNPAAGTNRIGIAGQAVVAQLVGGINDAGVRVVKAEYRQGVVGQYLVELDVPSDTATGPAQSLAVAAVGPGGNLIFGNGSQIPIR